MEPQVDKASPRVTIKDAGLLFSVLLLSQLSLWALWTLHDIGVPVAGKIIRFGIVSLAVAAWMWIRDLR